MTFSLRIKPQNVDRSPLLIASESITDDVMLGLAVAPDGMMLVANVDNRWYDIEPGFLLSDDCLDSSGRSLRSNEHFADHYLKDLNNELADLCRNPETAARIKDYLGHR